MRVQIFFLLLLTVQDVFLQVEIKFEGPKTPCPRREAQENLYISINKMLNLASKDVTDSCAIEVKHMQIINRISNVVDSLKTGDETRNPFSLLPSSNKNSPSIPSHNINLNNPLASMAGMLGFRSGKSKQMGYPRGFQNFERSRYFDDLSNREVIPDEEGEFVDAEFDRDRDSEDENRYEQGLGSSLPDGYPSSKFEINQDSLQKFNPGSRNFGISTSGGFAKDNPSNNGQDFTGTLGYKSANLGGNLAFGQKTSPHQADSPMTYEGAETSTTGHFVPKMYGINTGLKENSGNLGPHQGSQGQFGDIQFRAMSVSQIEKQPINKDAEQSNAKQGVFTNNTFQVELKSVQTEFPETHIILSDPQTFIPQASFQIGSPEIQVKPQPSRSTSKPKNCVDIQKSGPFRSAIYQIFIDDDPVTVYCDMVTDGGGWTVFQKRGNNGNQKLLFYRDWNEYKTGFGLVGKDFWLGNDKIHKLTQQGPTTMRIDIKDFEGNSAFAVYEGVKIGNEQQRYVLTYDKFMGGNAGNSLASGNQFFTYDVPAPGIVEIFGHPTCAQKWQSGWWYSSNPQNLACYSACLNGPYYTDPNNVPTREGVPIINWASFMGNHHILMETEMKLRLSNFTAT